MHEQHYFRSFLNRDRLIHILDADPSTCEALSVLFRLEGFRTGFSVDTSSFFAAIERRRPDAAIVNLCIGGDDGIAVLRRISSMRLGAPVFALEDEPLVETAVAAIKAGATDVVTKPIDAERLLRLLHDALQRHPHAFAPAGNRRAVELRAFSQLTPREHEVLQLISSGKSNKEAGHHLGISPRTIEVHRARVMQKLGARNTADLMRIVLAG